jgi:membrane protein required for beta-lactamase induction
MTYEHFNKKVDERKAATITNQQKKSLWRLIRILVPVAVVLLLIVALEAIGFISNTFCLALAIITLCHGCFDLGRVWHKIKLF